ncbi:MAG: MGH1-like glycoside hydrolase domain-containing protein [Aggregatilineales bacterium]
MRDWQLTAGDPLTMRLAADIRLSKTDYADDQSWEIAFGGPDEPALAVQTRYGGRVGLARFVPLWAFDGRAVYERQAFAEGPVLRAFAPDYARITARPIASLALTFEVWVMDSHAVGGRLRMRNEADTPATFEFDLNTQLAREGKVTDIKAIRFSPGADQSSEALHLGTVGSSGNSVNPVVLLEQASGSTGSHLSAPMTIPPGGTAAIRWVHAALPTLNDSLQTAQKWLYQTDWDTAFALIERINAPLPVIETENVDLDAALAFAAQVTLRSFVGATGKLPYPSVVDARIPAFGFSRTRDGADHAPEWQGQAVPLVYLVAPTAAILAPDLARGLIRNALAVAQSDGWIDGRPGLGGQRSGQLAPPLLASATWAVYQITEDKHFLAESFAALRRFYDRWFARDMDRDGDGVPEWVNADQSGFADSPTFDRVGRGAINADISKAETPDLTAYLIHESASLLHIAELLNKPGDVEAIRARLNTLTHRLAALWDEASGSYLPCDRDTHITTRGGTLFRGRGDEAMRDPATLDPPARLVLRILGGKEHAPRVGAVIEGIDAAGAAVSETIPGPAFIWGYGLGSAVTEHVYARINYTKFDGLSRVYSIEIDGVDLSRPALPNLLPLWAGVDKDRVRRLVDSITDPARYGQPAGLPLIPGNLPADGEKDAANPVHQYWNTLIVEGLIESGYATEARALVGKLMADQIAALKHDQAFRSAYDAQTGAGLGDPDNLNGVFSLALFMRLIGVRIVNARRVWAGGEFALPASVKVTQYGVTVTRSAKGSTVRFPSGETIRVGSEWQLITSSASEPEPAAVAPMPTTVPAPPKAETPAPPPELPKLSTEPTVTTTPPTYKIPVRRPKGE